ncbi:MAG: amino acid transporter [Bradymonadia bacterium]|jgi:amino acid transporter
MSSPTPNTSAIHAKPGQEPEQGNQFGAFGGVFTPSILTILGAIMFMRTGLVVGQAGVLTAIGILFVAKGITFLTSLSISAISTNTKVGGGGAYFLISRSMGPAYGGAIGLALFLAQAFSVPFYILALVEALVLVMPAAQSFFLEIGVTVAFLLFIINQIGASWAIKAQYGILGVLVLSIVAFLGGSLLHFDVAILEENIAPAYTDGANFWLMFALFFPAVTGIMAGVNMSGDLKDPGHAIPRGTLAAVFVGGAVYLLQMVITGGSIARSELANRPYESLLDNALFGMGWLVVAGVFAATLSSALGSFLGAPRILQALARDDIFPGLSFFGAGSGPGDEPKRGLWLTMAMTLGVLFMAGDGAGGGALNAVAAVLTMFFLYTYGMTNMAAFIEQFSQNPSFRPSFRFFHWSTALAGAVGCFGAAVLINPFAAAGALVIILLVFLSVQRRVLETTFGDSMRGFYYARVRSNLVKLADERSHAKNWRPTTLVLSGNPMRRATLATFAEWFGSERGLVTLAQIVIGEVEDGIDEGDEARAQLNDYIAKRSNRSFAEVIVAPHFDEALTTLIQSHSIGPIKPNLVMLGWPGSAERAEAFARHMRLVRGLGKSAIICIDRGLPSEKQRDRTIDIWWRSGANGSLIVILAYLLTLNWQWRDATLRIFRLLGPDEDEADAAAEIESLIEAGRIKAETVLVHGKELRHAVFEHSRDSDAVFMGYVAPNEEDAVRNWEGMDYVTAGLPTTILVMSSGEADLFS